ncbi:hypothetical protein [Catalinimonas alkaloidigena]|uniref:hypothetical protein n=1 Tax=Catalinimonas alkaloidigena TaxID=1075417 RepID=UPI001C40A2F6|nr:hypothetical protein [Catalinimonas alkaloidigena]
MKDTHLREKIRAIYTRLDGLRNTPRDGAQLERYFRELQAMAGQLPDPQLNSKLSATADRRVEAYRRDPSNANFRAWVYNLKRDLEEGGHV